MAITAELFDGTILEFPDGTDPSVIQATAKRMTLERQMSGGEKPRNELGEVVEKDPQGSKAYQAIKGLVDPIRPYVEPVTDYVGEQASLVAGAGLKGVANLQTSIAQSQVAGMMELQEARKAKYGTFENMPPEEQKNYLKAQKYIEGKLSDVAKLGVEKKDIEKKYGVRESTKALDSLSESPEYKEASFIGKMGMIGSKISDDPFGIITDLGLESIPQSYAIASAAIATRFGMLNPKIAAGVGGASSGMMQFGNEYAALREQGMDHVEAWEKAGVKSGIVGLFDAASFYSAGKAAGAVVDNIKKGAVKETVKTVAKETGKQATLGAAGEGVGSAVIGQEVDPLELTKEAIGEVFGAPGDAISTYQGKVAEARAAGKPDPAPPADVAKMMSDKGFTFKKRDEFAGAPQVDITGVGQVPAEETAAAPEQQLIDDIEASQDRQAMLAELEDERDLDRQLKQVSVQEPVVEETPPAEPKEKAPEFAKAVNVKDFNPEDKAAIRSMEVERNKIGREKKLFPEFLRRQGIQPSEKADLGLEGIRRADIFKKAAPTFDELTSRAISEGFLLSTGDDVQDVENFRQFVSDYIGSGIIGTGPDVAREGQLRAIDDSIQEIVRKYEQPAPIELTGQTPDEARAEAEALEMQRAEEQRVASEQQRAEQEARDRAEIARRSEGAAEDFQLGQTAEENLTGQKDIFAEPKEEKAAYTPPKLRTDNPGGEWLKSKREQSLESGKNKFGNPSRFGSVTGYYREGNDIRKPLIPVDVLARLQGINAEQQNVREKDLEAIKKIMDETGRLPQAPDGGDYVPFINVYQDGTAYVNEGNHRIMAAKALGFKYLPVEISYFNGAEQIESGDLSPKMVTSYDMQARDDKITLDNYRGEKKPKDMGAEAYPFVETKAPKIADVDVANVPLGDLQNGIIMGLNGENINSNLISDDAITLLKANELISVDGSGKVSLLPKGKSLSNAMYQARELSVEGRKELFAKFIPQIAVETKVKPTEEDPDADIPFAKATMEQKNAADMVAKEEGGKIVWQDGDFSLIETTNGTGKVIYKGANKTVYPRFQIDIADFKGDWIPADKLKAMRTAADKLRKEADKKAQKPFIKFTDGVAFSENVEKNVANVARQWKKLLNINNNVYITTFDDIQNNFDNFNGAQIGIRKALKSGKVDGVMQPLGNGDYVVAFKPNTSKTRMLEVLAHELGHVHEKLVFDSAPAETKAAIKEEYNKWVESQKGKTARELLNSLRALQLSKSVNIRDEKMMATSVEGYWTTFAEWYADQVSRWSTTSDKPLSVVDKFFAKIAETLRNFYTSLKGQGYLPNETFKKYLDDAAGNLNLVPEVADVGEQLSLFAESEMKERNQVNTPAFKKWFGDSKVIDEDGKPLVVYHGTLRDFTQFRPSAKKATRGGEALRDVGAMFFSANPELASAYSGTSKSILTGDFFAYPQSSAEGGNVMPVYLSMQNPLVVDAENQMYTKVEDIIRKAKKDGYDGVILKNIIDSPGAAGSLRTYEHTAYVAFNPNQIKSATGNIGTFDETNPDIRFDIKARAAEPPAYAEVERRPSLRVGIKRLLRQFNEGKIAPETLTNRIEFELDLTKDKKERKPRERGAFLVEERLNKAARRGELSAEGVQLAKWFISQNPALLDDLGISIKEPKEGAVASGYYNPMSRIFTLMKHSGNDETAVHEMLHHMERMLPEKVQDGIRKSWFTSLAKAAKEAEKGTDNNLVKFYKSLLEYHVEGDRKAMKVAEKLLEDGKVDYEHYQHINPSEFWAVNAADIVAGRYAQSKSTSGKLKQWLKELYQKLKSIFGLQSSAPILRALDSLSKADGRFINTVMIGEATQYLNRKNYKGGQAPLSAWQDPQESKLDNWLYKIQDKLIDTKRVQQAITQQVGEIEDNWNAYMKEELYHGRTAKRTQDFLKDDLAPIVRELSKAGIEIIEFDQYLHNRHAEERNIQNAKKNPSMPDSGSGIATADARQYLKDLDPTKRKLLEKLANKIDDIIQGTQKILIDGGLEEQSTVDAWNGAYKHYVPLKREDVDFVHTGTGLGQGFATRGATSARATGSLKKVAEVFANIALARERAIIRSEKARVGKALYGLALKNPNTDFWLPVNPDAIKNKAKLEQELINMGLDPDDANNFIQEPKQPYTDPRTGLVAYRVNPVLRTSDNVFPIRINGQDRFIFFNSSDERAMRMVSALKNLDADQLGLLMNNVANITRWIASVNTQYNPVFGAINFLRDVQGAALNLSTTPLAGKQKEIVKNTFPALKGIYSDLRGDGKGGGMWADLWEDFQEAGGQTGYRDQFSRNRKQASVVEREMGAMKRGRVKRAAYSVAQWLSDYNDAMENAVRLSAYKSALDMGLSKDKAASIAKNLTVNFNRKGANAQTVGALYAFFNASVQGTTRLVETMRGPAGRKIFYGGVALGALQAVALAAAGFDDDEPPEFIKSRNLIIPTGGKSYIAIPMPLGFNLFPNLGRLTTEFAISGGKKPVDKTLDLVSTIFNTFNPIGGTGLQLVAPTIVDPVAALYTNVDAFGRPISKEDRKTAPTPGYSRSREQASTVNKYIAEFLNYASGGTKYQKGALSPTADQLDYLVGQATGGVGRETMKAVGAVKALATGEELPSYKVPLAGKFYGNTESPANIASKFYDNVTQLANYENEIKGRRKNRENVGEFLREHPEARLYQRANQLENQITQLNRDKKELQERKAPQKQIDVLDKRKTMLMDKFNKDYKKASK
jgi:hypothetical protein